jgi:hypothetical protein
LAVFLECTTHMALKMLPRKDDRSYIYSSRLRRILHLLRDLMPTIKWALTFLPQVCFKASCGPTYRYLKCRIRIHWKGCLVLGPFTSLYHGCGPSILTLHQTHLWYIVYNLISKFSSCIMDIYIYCGVHPRLFKFCNMGWI